MEALTGETWRSGIRAYVQHPEFYVAPTIAKRLVIYAFICTEKLTINFLQKLKQCSVILHLSIKQSNKGKPLQIQLQTAQLRAPLSPLQTAWTGFDHCLYSGGSSSADPTLVENSSCKVFYTQQGHCDLTQCLATPPEPGECAVPLHQGCCQPGWCPVDGLAGLWRLNVKAQCLSACLPPRHPTAFGSVTGRWLKNNIGIIAPPTGPLFHNVQSYLMIFM